jgi:hypothetical protein
MIEPTVTQNNALYFAQHKIPQAPIPLTRRFALAFRKYRRKTAPQWPNGAVFLGSHIAHGNRI